MKIGIINITGGGMSGGYEKYLCNVLPRMAKHDDVEFILCASPDFICVQDWFDSMPSARFVSCKPMAGYQKKLKDWAQKNKLSDRICSAGNLNGNGQT